MRRHLTLPTIVLLALVVALASALFSVLRGAGDGGRETEVGAAGLIPQLTPEQRQEVTSVVQPKWS